MLGKNLNNISISSDSPSSHSSSDSSSASLFTFNQKNYQTIVEIFLAGYQASDIFLAMSRLVEDPDQIFKGKDKHPKEETSENYSGI